MPKTTPITAQNSRVRGIAECADYLRAQGIENTLSLSVDARSPTRLIARVASDLYVDFAGGESPQYWVTYQGVTSLAYSTLERVAEDVRRCLEATELRRAELRSQVLRGLGGKGGSLDA